MQVVPAHHGGHARRGPGRPDAPEPLEGIADRHAFQHEVVHGQAGAVLQQPGLQFLPAVLQGDLLLPADPDVADPVVAERGQVRRELADRAAQVEIDAGQVPGRPPGVEDHGRAGGHEALQELRARAGQDQPGEVAGHGPPHGGEAVVLTAFWHQDRQREGAVQVPGQALQHHREERVRGVRADEPDRFELPAGQGAGRGIDPVAEIRGGREDEAAQLWADPPGVLAREDQRHGRRGAAGPLGDIPGGSATAGRMSGHVLRFWHVGRPAGDPGRAAGCYRRDPAWRAGPGARRPAGAWSAAGRPSAW